MGLRLYQELVARAKHFLKTSGFDAGEERYDIALFHLEQAARLAVKVYLLRELGDFPKIHGLRDLARMSGNECLNKLVEDKWYIVDILDDAYTGSRYFIRSYGAKEYEGARRFVEEVMRCTGI